MDQKFELTDTAQVRSLQPVQVQVRHAPQPTLLSCCALVRSRVPVKVKINAQLKLAHSGRAHAQCDSGPVPVPVKTVPAQNLSVQTSGPHTVR